MMLRLGAQLQEASQSQPRLPKVRNEASQEDYQAATIC